MIALGLRFGMVKVGFCTATAQEWHTFERASIVPGQEVQGMRFNIPSSPESSLPLSRYLEADIHHP